MYIVNIFPLFSVFGILKKADLDMQINFHFFIRY